MRQHRRRQAAYEGRGFVNELVIRERLAGKDSPASLSQVIDVHETNQTPYQVKIFKSLWKLVGCTS